MYSSKVLGFLTRATDKSKGEFPILVNPYVLSETTHWGIRGMSGPCWVWLIKMQTSRENGNSKTPSDGQIGIASQNS